MENSQFQISPNTLKVLNEITDHLGPNKAKHYVSKTLFTLLEHQANEAGEPIDDHQIFTLKMYYNLLDTLPGN